MEKRKCLIVEKDGSSSVRILTYEECQKLSEEMFQLESMHISTWVLEGGNILVFFEWVSVDDDLKKYGIAYVQDGDMTEERIGMVKEFFKIEEEGDNV